MKNYKDYINPLITNFCNSIDNKDYKSITNEDKKDIKLFLLFMIITFSNANLDSQINNNDALNECFNHINLLNNPDNFIIGPNNTNIIVKIRNIFSHGTGVIIEENDHNMILENTDSHHQFCVSIDKDNLIKCLYKSVAHLENNHDNEILLILFNAIKDLDDNKFENIDEKVSIFAKLSLIFGYNKESLLDKYLDKQQCYLDCSNFIVKVVNPDKDIYTLRRRFFEKYSLIYFNNQDSSTLSNNYPNLFNSNQQSSELYLCITDKMAKKTDDKEPTTNKYVYPTPALITHLRNAISHGRMKINGDQLDFWDQKNGEEEQYIHIYINIKDMHKFLHNDIFHESVYTNMNTFEQRKGQLYFFERALAGNDFNNLVHIYQYKYQKPTISEAIDYMLQSDTLSSYVLEYPHKIHEVLNYQLENGENVQTYLEKKYNQSLDRNNKYSHQISQKIKWKLKYLNTLHLFIRSFQTKGGDLTFWRAYFRYLYNINRDKNSFLKEQLDFYGENEIDINARTLFEQFIRDDSSKLNFYKDNQRMIMQVMTVLSNNKETENTPNDKVEMFFNIITTLREGIENNKIRFEAPQTLNVDNVEQYSSYHEFLDSYESEQKNLKEKKINILVSRGQELVDISESIAKFKGNINDYVVLFPTCYYGCCVIYKLINNYIKRLQSQLLSQIMPLEESIQEYYNRSDNSCNFNNEIAKLSNRC